MTKRELNIALAAALKTMAEVTGPMPASALYLALGMDMRNYEAVADVLSAGGLAVVTPETLTITAAGREMAQKIADFARV